MTTKHANLWAALAAARASFEPVIKDKTAKTEKFSYRYVDLAAVLDAVMPTLCANGIAVYQAPTILGDSLVLISKLVHADTAQEVSDMLPLPNTSSMQQLGSAISYARRYLLMAQLGIAAGDDDDGQAVQPHTAPVRAATSQHTANSAKTQQRPPQAPTEASAQADEQDDPTLATPQMLKALHASGHRLYGDEWDAKRAELVRWATGGMAESSKQLTVEQCKVLLDGISDKLRKQAQAAAAQAQAQAAQAA